MAYIDQTMSCRDCGQLFIWSAGEQEFFASRGLASPPARCRECRVARRGAQTRLFDRAPGSDPYSNYGAPREMFTTTCAQCGQEARVPFTPRGHRPVYCSDCFAQLRSTERVSSGY